MEQASVDSVDCHLREKYASCKELPFYGEHEGKRYCVLHFPSENKEDEFRQALWSKLKQRDFNFAGTFFPEGSVDFSRFKFDADVSFVEVTFCGAAKFYQARFSGERTDFRGAQFSGAATYFRRAQFSGGQTNFSEARFSGERTSFHQAQFSGKRTSFKGVQFSAEWTYFSEAQFSGGLTSFERARFSSEWTYFSEAQFSGGLTSFERARFSSEGTSFERARFSSEGTSFERAQFSGERTSFHQAYFNGEQTSFKGVQFSGVETSFENAMLDSTETSFQRTTFKEKVVFLGAEENTIFDAQSWVRFDHCRIDKPELLTFNTVLLRPGWFVNSDVRKVDFTEVKWYGIFDSSKGNLEDEIKTLERHQVSSPYTLLAQACQRLAANAEENRDYAHASGFNYWAMEAQRRGKWASAFAPWRLLWWYWALSGYGERTRRSGMWLVGILVGFAVLYMLVGHVQGFPEAVVYSLGVMSRQAEKLPVEVSTMLRSLVFLEGILGPLQVALFALALRRRFMRGKG